MTELIDFLKQMPVWTDIDLAVANSVANLCISEKKAHGFITGLLLLHAANSGSVCIECTGIKELFTDIVAKELSEYKKNQFANDLKIRIQELAEKSPDNIYGRLSVIDDAGELILGYLRFLGVEDILNDLSKPSFYEEGLCLGEKCLQRINDSILDYYASDCGDRQSSKSGVSVKEQIRDVRTPVIYSMGRLYIARFFAYEISIASFILKSLKKESIDLITDGRKLSSAFNIENIHNVWTEVYNALDGDRGDNAGKNEVNWQKVAVAMSLCHPFSVITGGPGTGKTYTVSILICLLKKINPELRIGIAAPTGKAAARVKESLNAAFTGEMKEAYDRIYPHLIEEIAPAETIHKMLKIYPGQSISGKNENEPLDCDVLIIDEVSMMDVFLMNKVFAALKPDARLILLGDKDQLSSVEAGSVLGDICSILERKGQNPELTPYEMQVIERLTGYGMKELASEPGLASGIASLHKSRRYKSSPLIGLLAEHVNIGRYYSDISGKVRDFDGAKRLEISTLYPDDYTGAFTSRGDCGIDGTGVINGVAMINGCDRDFVGEICRKAVNGWKSEKRREDGGFVMRLPQECADYRMLLEFMAAHPVLSNHENENGNCSEGDSYIAKAFGMINRFRILCPERQGYFGVRYINDCIAEEALRFVKGRINRTACPEAGVLTKNWYPGLILMITKNDENLELRNGDVVICGYDADQPGSKRVWVQMENKKFRSISFGMLSDYETGFAMTIHKSQGSEFDHTMMIMNGTERTITRELVYTGITRAKSFVTMVTGNDGKHDVKNLNERFNVKVRRTSGLDERLYGKDKA